jgi:hypothetical protein
MLFETDRHQALCADSWNPELVRETIQAIVGDVDQSRLPQGHWPIHALDNDGSTPPVTGYQSIYLGSAGIIWALWYLQREGAAHCGVDTLGAIELAAQTYQSAPDTDAVVPSYFLGEVGIQLVRWRLTGSSEAADRLYASIQQNIPNPTNEALWAAPGTMVAAWHLWEQTGEERWRTLFAENIEQLWQTWLPVPDKEFYLWTQDLYGHIVQLLGAGHGFVGNVYPLLRGAALLDAARREALYERCSQTLRMTGMFENGEANWPQGIGTPRPGRTNKLMQWCHGAPGVITAIAADYPHGQSSDMDAMLLAGGEAVWTAGPVSKGYGLCHGTAGNGYAFLKLFKRTGNALWLDRARAFAMHAIVQRRAMYQQYGVGRYNLWTGDLGLAVYLWHCMTGKDGMPVLDIID